MHCSGSARGIRKRWCSSSTLSAPQYWEKLAKKRMKPTWSRRFTFYHAVVKTQVGMCRFDTLCTWILKSHTVANAFATNTTVISVAVLNAACTVQAKNTLLIRVVMVTVQSPWLLHPSETRRQCKSSHLLKWSRRTKASTRHYPSKASPATTTKEWK